MYYKLRQPNFGEVLVAWIKYKANKPEELSLNVGEMVEVLDTNDPSRSAKRIKLDPDLDSLGSTGRLLDNTAARHKLSVKPHRKHVSSRYSPTRSRLDARWLVRQVQGEKRQGWVPCHVLQSADEPTPGTGLPGDAAFRRQAVVKELVETEQEFVKDLDFVVQQYLVRTEAAKVPKIIKDNLQLVFGGLLEIAEFHRTVLMEGVKYYANEPNLLGKAFLRLERDFDKHVNYCTDEPLAQSFLETCDVANTYFDELSQRLGDEKTLSEHLKLPIQRINDYQLLLKELVRYSECLGEDCTSLQKALELMLSVPHRAEDDKFTSSIEGYRGSIHKLGRLLSHDWFSVTFGNVTKERYLFLFKARILVSKVRRISEDRSVFQLKDIIRLPQVEIKDHPDNNTTFELVDKVGGHSLTLIAHRDQVKQQWLKEIREFASEASEEQNDDIQLFSEASTLTSEVVPADAKPFAPPNASEAQKLLANVLKSERKQKAKEEPKVLVIEPERPKPKVRKLEDTAESSKVVVESKIEATKKSSVDVKAKEAKEKENKGASQGVEGKIIGSLQQAKVSVVQVNNNNNSVCGEVKLSVEEDMSRRYSGLSSSGKGGEEYDASFSRRTIKQSSYGTEGGISSSRYESSLSGKHGGESVTSKYGSDSLSSKYGVESSLSGKYGSESIAGKYGAESLSGKYASESITGKYGAETISGKYRSESIAGKYGTESISGKYGSDSIAEKYGSESISNKYGVSESISSKYGADLALSGKYGSETISNKYSTESTLSGGKYGEIGDGTLSYTRRTIARSDDSDGGKYGAETSYTSRRTITDSGNGDAGLIGSSYTRKYHTELTDDGDDTTSSYTRKHGIEAGGDGESYSYSRKTITSTEGGGDLTGGSRYRRTVSSEIGDATGSSKYTKRSLSSYDDDEHSREALLDKYLSKSVKDVGIERHESTRRSLSSEHEDDHLSKFSKYERRISETAKKTIVEDEEEARIEAEMRRKYAPDANRESFSSSEHHSSKGTESIERKRGEVGEAKEIVVLRESAENVSTERIYKSQKSREDEGLISGERAYKSQRSIEEEHLLEKGSTGRRAYASQQSKEECLLEIGSSDKQLTETAYASQKTKEEYVIEKDLSEKIIGEKSYKSQRSQEEEFVESKRAHATKEAKKDMQSKEDQTKTFSETSEIRSHKISTESIGGSSAVKTKAADGSVVTTFKIRRDSSTASLPAEGKPTFTKTLFGVNVEPGESAVFEVALRAAPEALTWLKDNKPITQSNRIKTTKLEEDRVYRLEIKEADISDAGLYSAIATNNLGKSTCSAQLIVHELTEQERAERLQTDKPVFLIQLKDTELLEDTYLRFMVKVKGDPSPHVIFYKDDAKIRETNKRCHVITEAAEKGFYELVIPDVKQEDAGLYKCLATNKFGEIVSEARVTVTESKNLFDDLPEEPTQPGEKPVFTWKRDGVAFEPEERFKVLLDDDEDSLALVFQHVRPEDAGLYTCVAQTSSGHISCSAELTVHGVINQLLREPEKPKLEMETKIAEATVGSSAMLELQVKGYPKPDVKWKHDGKPIEPSGKYKFLYEDEESMSLVIKDVKAEDAGVYQAEAKNELGSDTTEITLNVKAPPKIKTKIEDISEAAELTIKVPVEVEGIPKPTIQFYKDGQMVKKSERIKVVEEGEKHTLIIEKSSVKDSGSYSVVASNEVSQVSEFFNMDVHCKPKIVKKLGSDKIISQKEELSLSVQLESRPEPEITWYKNEKEISSDEYITKKDGDDYILKISGAVTTDSARYKFKANNIYGSVEDECRVDVRAAPRILKELKDMTVNEHEKNIELDVKLHAFPKPSIKWYLDEMEITESRNEFTRIESDDGSKLVIKEVTSELSGRYKCKVINELGDTETSAKLTVNCKPRIIKHLKDTIVDEGATLHLEVEVDACPEPTVKWLRNGREVSVDARIKITRDKHRNENYHLAVDLIKYEEGGEYEVIVTNSLGTVSSKSTVTVQKLTHTDAIEESEPIPKHKLKVEVIENVPALQKPKAKDKDTEEEAKKGVTVDKVEIEEIVEEKFIKPLETSTDKHETAKGTPNERCEIKEDTLKSPEPIIEEPMTPEAQIAEKTSDLATKPNVDLSQNKPKYGKSIQEETPEIIELENNETPIEQTTMSKAEKGFPAEKETIVEHSVEDNNAKSVGEKNVPMEKLSRGISADLKQAEVVENNQDVPKTPMEEDVAKEFSRGLSVKKEEVEVVDFLETPRRMSQQSLERRESLKGVKSFVEEDACIEDLLNRAQRQRSLVEDISKESEQAKEAAPLILDSTLIDKTQYESLGVSYVVKASGNPKPTATWSIDDKPIKADSHFRMSNTGEEFQLDIEKLEPKAAGVIVCKLSNVLGDAQTKAKLSVIPEAELRKPIIKEGLEDQTILKKKPSKLSSVITGDPVPEVTWCINGREVTPNQYEKHNIILDAEDRNIEDGLNECTFSLTIPESQKENSGIYTIKAKNKWGEAESSAQLTIVLRPEIEGLQDVSVVPGNGAEFTVKIHANPEPDVTWYKDGKVLESGRGLEIMEDVENEMYKIVIPNVQMADEGRYKVSAKNAVGETIAEAKLRTIKEAGPTTEKPKFITGITDAEVDDQGEITLKVRADGLPKPEIYWFFNGKPLQEDEDHKISTKSDTQVTSTLTINNYSKGDIGQYKAMAVNVVGEAETTADISMVKASPSFGKRFDRSEDVNEGEPLELKAKVLGSPKPAVAWYKDGEQIPTDDAKIKTTILPDGMVKLNIDAVTPNDCGAYKLMVKNDHGENSALCAVAVNPTPKRPKFLKCIKDMKATEGEPLRLEAKVSGYPEPEIKWQKDGVPVRASSNIHLEAHPDGSVALIVDCLKPENAGTYTLIATNKLGESENDGKVEISKKAMKPEFMVKMQPLTVVEGFPAKFEVKAKGFPAPTITWTRNGVEIVPDNKHIIITDLPDGGSALFIDACDIARDPMTYKAIASNNAGDAQTGAELSVTPTSIADAPEEPPALLHNLRDISTDEDQPLVMEVPFTANPMPKVEWFKDDEPLEPSDRILLTCDGKKVGLHIDKATPADAGKYSVKLSNPLGSDCSDGKAVIHKVFSPPRFTQRFSDLQQLPDHDAKLYGKVAGIPTPEVTWYKDGVLLTPSDKYRIKREADACSLYISNCKASDAGLYRAFAVNKEGSDTCEAKLDVVDEIKMPLKTEPPSFLKRIGDLDLYKGMTAKFTACASGIPEPKVEWYQNDDKLYPSERVKMEIDKAGLLRLTIFGIDQDDLGKYSCKISNDHGSDICHANLRFDDLDSKPKKPLGDEYLDFDKHKRSGLPVPLPDAPIISRMTDRHCTLSWRPSIPSHPRAPVTYQLEMCELPHGDWFIARSGIRNCVCTVGNLEPFRDYRFRVRVENKYGMSDPSPYATTYRQKLEPDPPRYRSQLPIGTPFHPDTSPYFPKDFDIERPPHDHMSQPPRFLRQEHPTQFGVKDQNTNLFWFVYGYPKPKMEYFFNDEPIGSGGRFDMSYTRNGQATLFINKMLDRDVGWYEAVATNEHGQARQRVRLEIAEMPEFIKRPDITYSKIRGTIRFEARILGQPYPEVKWYKDWKPLAESSRIKIKFLEPDLWILTIDDVILKDEGLYSVSARNFAGTISSSAMLYVDENDSDYKYHTYGSTMPIKLNKRKLFDELYDLGDELGRGTQGITYHAVDRGNGNNYAAKIMHGRGDVRMYMQNEYDILNQLPRHQRLISLHDAYETDDRMILVLELGGGGELVKDYLLKRDYYTESDIAFYIRQMLEGIQYMHERGYGHMGLNIGDLLLSHHGGNDLKITDFGLARRISPDNLYPLKYGVPEYTSPEAVRGEGTGFGHDMWSIGIITHILLSGRSPFLGKDDRETLTRIKDGSWAYDMSWWSNISVEARDFISELLMYSSDGRMDVHTALRHPWLQITERRITDEYRISSSYLRDYFILFRDWYDNASCRRWYRRRPLEGAFTHPSRMVYPPGDMYTPPPSPSPRANHLGYTRSWEDQLPTRSPLNYEIGLFKSESHYQNGPDTYLLQLRDVNFPVRVREYMKVAANRGPGRSLIVSNENGFDWNSPTVRERRRFTDVMDEEIDDERKQRINRYGADNVSSCNIRRLRRELGPRLDTYAEAEAMIEMKQDGRLPFFREKPQIKAMVEGQDLDMTCYVVGDPKPLIQWFKNDAIVVESARVKIETDKDGRSHFKLRPALGFDLGMYRVVARNKIGQTVAWTRIVYGTVPDSPDSPEPSQISDTEILLMWKPPKSDGNSPVLCYGLQYKLEEDSDWIKRANNIDHEFYLVTGLEKERKYMFRLAALNAIGWSDYGVATAPVSTLGEGTAKIQLSKAMQHLQQITDSGQKIGTETGFQPDYSLEATPVDWLDEAAESRYDLISEISGGRFSAVFKGIDKQTDKLVVAKLIDLTAETPENLDGEFAALRSLRHERIAVLLAAYRTSQFATFILEKLQGADVLTYLASKHEYTEQTVATIVTQILDGLQYLHWRNLCHLDIQPDNVVMCGLRSIQVKLVDFGAAHRVTKLGTEVPILGHPDYISPEVLNEEQAFPQTDIWSLGVLTYVMLSGMLPFKGADDNESRQNVSFVRYRFEYLFQELSQEGNRFIMLIFKRHPNKRPTAEECHENRWLLPTDSMIKKRERAVFLGSRLKEYCEKYHNEKSNSAKSCKIGKSLVKSHSIQEELLIAP